MKIAPIAACLAVLAACPSHAAIAPADLDAAAAATRTKLIEWRRDFHLHPELANREFLTFAKVADHLRALGLVPRTEITHAGVVAVIEGKLPGPTILLRADMDALPVTEGTEAPFRSTATGEFRGRTVGFMHACGWAEIDPIVVASEIVGGLQTIVSRELDITKLPAVIKVGAINRGVRYNFIP